MPESFLEAVRQFSWGSAALLLEETEENRNYSPLSLYYALALAAQGASGTTEQEFLDLLGVGDREELAEDVLLMKELEISWAPVIPYMPAANTPLKEEGGFGSLLTNLKEIALLRLMMPDVDITAQQPGEDKKKGLADPEGNRNAVRAGANILFCDLLPDALARNFRVIDNRNVSGTEHLYQVAELTGKKLVF